MKIKIPSFRKKIECFLNSEEGRISKKNVLELGAGLAMLGLMLTKVASAVHRSYFQNITGGAQHQSGDSTVIPAPPSSANHISQFENVSGKGQHTSHSSHASHGSHASHASHGSHTSHTSHGSHTSHVSCTPVA